MRRSARDSVQTQEIVSAVWREVLDRPVAADDNFFRLGGTSLDILRVCMLLSDELGFDVPITALLQAESLADLAAAIDLLDGDQSDAKPSIESSEDPTGSRRASLAQERVLCSEPEGLGPQTSSAYSFDLRGHLDVQLLHASLQSLVDAHESLRTSFARSGTGALATIAPPGTVEVELEVLRPGDYELADWRTWLVDEANRPFDRARPPLIRGTLIRLNARRHRLLVVIDHLATDGWSNKLLFRELSEAYARGRRGEPLTEHLTEPLTEAERTDAPTYLDWGDRQRALLERGHRDVLARHWSAELPDGRAQGIRLPGLLVDSGDATLTPRSRTVQVPADIADAVRDFARDEGVTLFDVGLSALVTVLAQETGASRVPVFSSFANRESAATSEMVGWMSNDLSMALDAPFGSTMESLVHAVHDKVVLTMAHADLSHWDIRDLVLPNEVDDFDEDEIVYFTVEDRWPDDFTLDGLVVEHVEIPKVDAVRGLEFWLREEEAHLELTVDYAAESFTDDYLDDLLSRVVACLVSAGVRRPAA